MNFDEWHEQAGRAAYERAFLKHAPVDAPRWVDIDEAARESWREVARAVLAEGKIEVRPSAELAEEQTRDENERLTKIARERAEDAQSYRDAADDLKSKLAGLRRAYDHACVQRDKYKRRTTEWRDVAQNDTFRQAALWLASGVGREHLRRCEIEQCDTCSGVLGIEERLQLIEDDGVRACTGCGKCSMCRKKTDELYRGPLATQGPNDNCKSGCHNYAWHCGRCGGCTGYQGHHWSHCKVTGTVREFHMCCPDDCELSAADEGQR